MRKIFLFATAAAVALSSCSKNEVTTSMGDNTPIGFGVYTGVSTKGTVVTTETLGAADGAGFGVLGYYHQSTTTDAAVWSDDATPNFMYNQQVNGDGDADKIAWSYSPLKYWPNNTVDRVSFFAYAPYTAQTTGDEAIELSANTKEGVPSFDFSIADAVDMVDLVVAKPRYELNKTKNAADVPFTFSHVLTRLNITAWASSDITANSELTSKTNVYVTDLQLVGSTSLKDKDNKESVASAGLYASNTFTFASRTNAEAANPTGITAIGEWGTATKATDDIDLAGVMTKTAANQAGYTESSKLVTTASTGIAKATPTALFTADQFAFLLPPNGNTGIATGSEVYLYVEYDVVTTDANLNGGHSVVTQQDIVALPAATLKAGVAYNINLELALTGVKLSATVSDDWASASSDDIVTPKAPVIE